MAQVVAAPTSRSAAPLRRALGRIRHVSPDAWALVVIALAVVLANLPYLLGIVDPSPLGPASGLTSSIKGGFVGGVHVLDPNIGYTSQALGHRAALDLLHLRLPWWNPYEATGAPLAADMNSAALFPPTLLLALGHGQLLEHMLLELAAGIGTFLLLRRIAVGRWASTVAGLAFALNGTAAWFGHAAANPVALLALLVLGVELAYASTVARRRGGWWLIAVAGSLSLYAGFPETAYVDGLFAASWWLWRWRCAGRGLLRPFVAKAVVGGLVGALLSAPILVPFLGYLPDAFLAAHRGAGYDGVHLAARSLPQLVIPYVYGNPSQYDDAAGSLSAIWATLGGYLTMSLVLFACFGLASRTASRGLRALLAAWLALALARMYGVPILGDAFKALPGMSSVEFSRYAWPTVELAVVVLAGLGLDAVAKARPSRRVVAASACGCLAIVAIAAVGASALVGRLSALPASGPSAGGGRPWWSFAIAVAAATAVVIVGCAAALARSRRLRRGLASAVVAADMLVMFVLPELSSPRRVNLDLAPVAFLADHAGLSRFVTVGPFRPGYGSYFGVASVNDVDLPVPEVWAQYVHRRLDPYARPNQFIGNRGHRPASAPSPTDELVANLPAYRDASVAYVLADSPIAGAPTSFTRVFRSASTTIYRIAGSAPYFSASPDCVAVAHSRTSVRVTCPRPATLVRRETSMPGWQARVDGRSTPVAAAGLFQAVAVGGGSHDVTFSYAPPGLDWALAAFALGGAWLVAGIGSERAARRARRGAARPAPADAS